MFDFARGEKSVEELILSLGVEKKLAENLAEAASEPKNFFSQEWAQPLVVAATLAHWHIVKDLLVAPSLIAGYSLGEISAQALGGSIDFGDAIAFARARGQAMARCVFSEQPHTMVAVSGVHRSKISDWSRRHNIYISIETGPSHCVLGGLKKNIDAAVADLKCLGGSVLVTPLKIETASHTPLMQGAADELAKTISRQFQRPNRTPVLSGVTAQAVTSPEQIHQALFDQLTQTLHWAEGMDHLGEQKIQWALELGPGSDLSQMMKKRWPEIQCRSVAEFKTVNGLRQWVQKMNQI
jgi:[acyl-carrier-protein] S-malonyltransferase